MYGTCQCQMTKTFKKLSVTQCQMTKLALSWGLRLFLVHHSTIAASSPKPQTLTFACNLSCPSMRIRKRWPPPLSVSPLVAPPDVISSTPQPSRTQPLHHNFTGQDLRLPEPQLVKVSTINGCHWLTPPTLMTQRPKRPLAWYCKCLSFSRSWLI